MQRGARADTKSWDTPKQRRTVSSRNPLSVLGNGLLAISFSDRARPDNDAEADLVNKVRKVINHIEHGCGVLRCAACEVAEDVTDRIDGPAKDDDETHQTESTLDRRSSGGGVNFSGFTKVDFVNDESPTGNTEDKSGPDTHHTGFAEVSENEHDQRADDEAPENTARNFGDSGEDQEELDHQEGHCDKPVDVAKYRRGIASGHPDITHVEVVNRGHQADETRDGQGGLPFR